MTNATVIIPTRGRPVALKNALRSLLATDPRGLDVEILVVDNNSDDALSADLQRTCAEAGDLVRYTAERSPGQTAARHRGAMEAQGELLIYVDDDVQVSKGWLSAFLRAFEDEKVGMAGGPSIPAFAGSVPSWFWDFLRPTPYGGWSCGWLSLLDIGKSVSGIDPVWIWGLNLAIRRAVLHDVGGFHPDLVPAELQRWQGDGETGLSNRVTASGVHCVYLDDALLHHSITPDRLTPEYFSRRAFYQGVCDSFTRIRAGEAPVAAVAGPRPLPKPPGEAASPWVRAAYDVKTRAAVSYNDGWIFHQNETASDPLLLEWVRRPDFFTADIDAEIARRDAR